MRRFLYLPPDPRHTLAVFPGADHNLFLAEPDRSRPIADQMPAGFLPMLARWLAA